MCACVSTQHVVSEGVEADSRGYLLFRGRRGCSSDVKFLPLFSPPSNSQSSGIESLFPYYTHTRTANKTKFLLACKAEEAKFLTLRSSTQRETVTSSPFPRPEKRKKAGCLFGKAETDFQPLFPSLFCGGNLITSATFA